MYQVKRKKSLKYFIHLCRYADQGLSLPTTGATLFYHLEGEGELAEKGKLVSFRRDLGGFGKDETALSSQPTEGRFYNGMEKGNGAGKSCESKL